MKIERIISLIVAILVVNTGIAVIHSAPVVSYGAEKEKKICLEIYVDPPSLPLNDTIRLSPEPVEINYTDNAIYATYYNGTEVSVFAEPIYERYGFIGWKREEIGYPDPRDPVKIKLHENKTIYAIYGEMTDMISVDKQVFNKSSGEWEDSAEIYISEQHPVLIKFKGHINLSIVSHVEGIDEYKLYVVDQLPEGMVYEEKSSNYPVIYNNVTNTLVWYDLPLKPSITVYFNATASGKGDYINRMYAVLLNKSVGVQSDGTIDIDEIIKAMRDAKWSMDYSEVKITRVYKLSYTVEPPDAGKVEIDPKWDMYPEGTEVTLEAKPINESYNFSYWIVKYDSEEAAIIDENPLHIVVDANMVITAVFKEVENYTLTVVIDPPEGGKVNISPYSPDGSYKPGTEVNLTAIANESYFFENWSGDIGNANKSNTRITIIMNSSKTITAHFVKGFILNVSVEPEGAGKVTISPEEGYYKPGSRLNLTAMVVNDSYKFSHWVITKDGNESISNQTHLTIIMDADTNVTAVFLELKKYYLNVSCEPEEGGTVVVYPPSIDRSYYEGTVVNLTAIAKKGYFFENWSGDIGDADPTNSTIKIVMDSDKDITAHFVKGYVLNISVEPEGAGEVVRDHIADYYEPGENVTLTAIAHGGYIFDHWEGVGDDADIYNSTITITMDSDKNITAVFEIQPKIVFIVDDSNDTLTVTSVSPMGISWDDIEIYCYNDTDSAYIEMQGKVEVGDVIYVRESGLYGEVTVNITWRPSDTLLASYKLYIEGGAPTYYTLTVDIYPDGAGYLYIDPPGENYSGYTEIDYKENTTVTITAHHHEGYIFDHWEGVGDDADIYNSTITVTMSCDQRIVAHFREAPAPPEVTVKITRPKEGYLYIWDKEILSSIIGGKIKLPFTIVIGAITIEANVTGDVDHVNFIVGCETKETLYEAPFNYTWDETAIGIKKIKVEACDSEGNVLANDTITVWTMNLNICKAKKETAVIEGEIYRYGARLFKKIPLAEVIAYRNTEEGWVKEAKTRSGTLPFNKGYYKLKLEPGYYMIKVVADGYETGVKYANVSAGENLTIDFYLNKTVTIEGRVKEKGIFGKGIKGANITAIRESDNKTYTTTSKLLGFYRLNLPPGNYTIIVNATSQGYKLYNESIQVSLRILLPDVIIKNFYLEPEEEETNNPFLSSTFSPVQS